MSHHKKIYVNPSHTKKIFANMRREGNDFSGRITPLFETMMVQPTQDEGVDSGIPTDSNQIPITTQPSSSRSQKKQSWRKQRKDTAVTQEEPQQDDSVPTPSNDPPIIEKAKNAQAKEIADLKKRVQKLERQKKSRTIGLKRLRKVGMFGRVESPEDKDIDDTQGRSKRLARKKEEEANIALIKSWDNTQAMIEADFELDQRLQTEEHGEITIGERSRLFVELMNKRKKHFAMLRAEKKRIKPPTKAQKRNLMSTYLKNMCGYKHNQLKSMSYEEI
ncbi:hypothetical protein Tco_0064255 [Tanacetum coccineum]